MAAAAVLTIAAAGLVIGICSVWWPELPGNGKSILTVSLASGLTLGSAVVMQGPRVEGIFTSIDALQVLSHVLRRTVDPR